MTKSVGSILALKQKMSSVLVPEGLPISCNNTNFSAFLMEGWTFNLKKKSLVLKTVSQRLKQMIPMILLHVMTVLTKLFYILTAAFCEGNWSD